MPGAFAQITHKRGDTFSYGASDVLLPSGESWIASAQVRDPLAPDSAPPLSSLTCILTPPVAPAQYWDLSLYAPATDTAKWPVNPNYAIAKTLVCDVQFTCQSDPSIVVSSATLQILIYRDVTR
jgi:hypothetical protein